MYSYMRSCAELIYLGYTRHARNCIKNGVISAGGALPIRKPLHPNYDRYLWLCSFSHITFKLCQNVSLLRIEPDDAYRVHRNITCVLVYFPKIRFIHFTVENNNIILQNILILNRILNGGIHN